MNNFKKLCGRTVIDNNDSDELCRGYKIELEYYQIKSEASDKPYGIEIVKRSIENNIVNIEEKTIHHLCYQEQDSCHLLEILKANKVTPVAVDDIIQDLAIKEVI